MGDIRGKGFVGLQVNGYGLMESNKVSVIIPIYKVEAFIERCATTLMEQTLHEVEYIFVDDATPDRSILF